MSPDERRRTREPTKDDRMRSDAELLTAARTDPAAFRELYERYAVRIEGYHLRRCGDPHAALDLTAETFAQAWLARARFRDEAAGSASPWLHGIARHVLLVSVRKHRIERAACERLGILSRAGEPAAEPDERWLDGLDEALATLPEAQQDAIRMRVVEDMTYDEAAGRLDTTPQVVRSRVSRGLGSLRRQLSDTMETTR
jgi:RNA polymerase sigma factor (sigma-70 family)